ncbi:sorting nexin-6-like [Trematomus bernacchii]|uniref:sorting nexin-6-like n=1 Tax=Trematomus bernacchii TaxID=40690 RepID=UPI00146EABC4|nr:sorting nexin-6-like [Trematomus bernacchii]
MVGEHALFPGISPAGNPIGHSKSSIPPAGGTVFPLEKSLFFRAALAPPVPVMALFLLGLMRRGTRDPMKAAYPESAPGGWGVLLQFGAVLSLSLRRLSTRIDMEIRDSWSCGSSSGARWFLRQGDFFEHEKTFLLEYHNRVKDTSAKSDRMIRSHKNAADDINRIALSLYTLGTQDSTDLCKFFLKVSELFEKTRKIESRVATDEDLKLADLLKYYLRESQAAKDLLYRRSRALVDYENANKALDKSRAKNRDVLQAETSQQLCCHKFEKISESAKQGRTGDPQGDEVDDHRAETFAAFVTEFG